MPGHWEGDLIMGAANASAIGTLVERTTNYTLLLHLPAGHRAEQVTTAITEPMTELPKALRRSLTWDDGQVVTDHGEHLVVTALTSGQRLQPVQNEVRPGLDVICGGPALMDLEDIIAGRPNRSAT